MAPEREEVPARHAASDVDMDELTLQNSEYLYAITIGCVTEHSALSQ